MAKLLADQLEDNIKEQEVLRVKEEILIKKAYDSNHPTNIIRARSHQRNKSGGKGKSMLIDPYQFNEQLGYKDKPLQISYRVLRNMGRTPIIKSIITTRKEQIAAFSDPQEDENKLGWTIRKKKGTFIKHKDEKVTDEDRQEMEYLVEFLLNGGEQKNKWGVDDFDTFLRKMVPDSLEIDQTVFEVVRNRGGKPIQYYAVDGATFRLSSSFLGGKPESEVKKIDGYYPHYVQLYNGLVRANFYPWELSFGIRNTSTNMYNNGYGISELEDMVRITTWMIYGDMYNGKFFSQGAAPKGMIKLKGNIDDDSLAEFKQQWRAQVGGVENAWKVPIVQADEMDWIDLQKTNKDMEFGKWQEYLIRLSCALYKIDPKEIGFDLNSGSGDGGGGVTYEGNQEYKLKYSKDKGLYPLLKFYQRKINKFLIEPLSNSKYEFAWTGIEDDIEDAGLDNDIKKLTNFTGLKEMRRKWKLPDHIDDDDIILNPVWAQWKMAQQQMQQFGSPDSNIFMDGQPGADQSSNPFMGKSPQEQAKMLEDAGNPFENPDKMDSENNPFMADLNVFMKGMMPDKIKV